MWVLIYVSTILFYALCLPYFFFIFSFSPFFCLLFDWWDFFISSPPYFPQWFGTLFLCFQKVCLSFYDACLNNQSLKLMNVLVCIVVAQLPSRVWVLATPWTAARLTSHCPLHLLEFSYVHVHWISDAIPTISSSVTVFSSCLQSFPASGFFSNESGVCIMWPKYWSFSFSISPSKEFSG